MLSAAALAAAAGPATALTQEGLAPAEGGTLKQEGVKGAHPPSPFREASQEDEEEEEEPELLFAPDLIISQVSDFTITRLDALGLGLPYQSPRLVQSHLHSTGPEYQRGRGHLIRAASSRLQCGQSFDASQKAIVTAGAELANAQQRQSLGGQHV